MNMRNDLDIVDFTYNFNIHYLMSVEEAKKRRHKPNRKDLLIKFIKNNKKRYNFQTWKVFKTIKQHPHRALWVFDQWFYICHDTIAFDGAFLIDSEVQRKVKAAEISLGMEAV